MKWRQGLEHAGSLAGQRAMLEEKKRHHTVIVKQTDPPDTKWCRQLRDYDVNSTQQFNWGSRSFQSAHIIYSWSVWFLSRTYLGLLVKVRGQLNQPRRLHCSHITHVVFWRLHHFVENHPGNETTFLVKEHECHSKCVSDLYVDLSIIPDTIYKICWPFRRFLSK